MLDYLANNHDKLLFVIAAVSLIIELSLIGLSGPLIFFSIGCAITGLLVNLGVINTWEMEVLSVGMFSFLSAIILWKPLKNFQNKPQPKDESSDMIGQIVPVREKVTASGGKVRHSGIDWTSRLDSDSAMDFLDEGARVKITAIEGTVLIVKEVD